MVFKFLRFEERFRDGLVWTVGLTVEIKLCFRDGLVWTVGLTVEIKLRFRDGLVWTGLSKSAHVSCLVCVVLRCQGGKLDLD